MCSGEMHRSLADPFSFSTIHFLRTCNRLITPTEVQPYYNLVKDDSNFQYGSNTTNNTKPLHELKKPKLRSSDLRTIFPIPCPKEVSPTLPPLSGPTPAACSPINFDYFPDYHLSGHSRLSEFNYSAFMARRQRGEKKPIPDEQKDEKYFERRKRNNEAAKKSRDARKLREDRIAFRAAVLEQENAFLRAQILALREEMTTLRQMVGSRPAQISVSL